MDKFKAMVHLIIASCDDPHQLGAIRLNKICWYSDTAAYRASGVPISPEKYVKRAKGPVPKTVLAAIRDLQDSGKILVKVKDHPVYQTRLFYSLEQPDTSMFSDDEVEIIQSTLKVICENFTANSISELTHNEIWAAAVEGEEIPLNATLVSQRGEVTGEITAWADSVLSDWQSNQLGGRARVATN
jgi:Protein of unknown function (DUF4065)